MNRSDIKNSLKAAVQSFIEHHYMDDYLSAVDPDAELVDKGCSNNFFIRLNLHGGINGQLWLIASEPVVASSIPLDDVIEYDTEMKDWSIEMLNQIGGIFASIMNENNYNIEIDIPEIKVIDGMIELLNSQEPPLTIKVDLVNNHSISIMLKMEEMIPQEKERLRA